MKPELAIVVAIDQKRGIGNKGGLPWPKIPEDMKRFRDLTIGHPVIMGRVTYDSIPEKFRPLPNRQNIVITRNEGLKLPGVMVVHSLEEAIAEAKKLDQERICVMGGGEIYKQALPIVDTLYLTRIDADFQSDTFFPEYKHLFTVQRKRVDSSHDGLVYHFEDLQKASVPDF